jgi:hypothetical protein
MFLNGLSTVGNEQGAYRLGACRLTEGCFHVVSPSPLKA